MNQPIIKVVNGHQDGFHSGVYCGRTNMLLGLTQSVLANPYKIDVDGDRDQCCDKYHEWLRGEYRKKGMVFRELERLKEIALKKGELALVCYCAPQRCHANSIKAAIEGMIGNPQGKVTRRGVNLPKFKIKDTVRGTKGRLSHDWHGVVKGIQRIRKDENGYWIYYYQILFKEREESEEKLIAKKPIIGMLEEQLRPDTRET